MLPTVLPGVQILTWGYNADMTRFPQLCRPEYCTVHQHTTGLLSDLAETRQEGPKLPIIFVHTLRRIIVKYALMQSMSTEGTRLKEIPAATFNVTFLGTPHRGSKSASLGRYAYESPVLQLRDQPEAAHGALERNSEVLYRETDAFNQMLLKQEIDLYSFREEQETSRFVFFQYNSK